jgi:hypothetical protein
MSIDTEELENVPAETLQAAAGAVETDPTANAALADQSDDADAGERPPSIRAAVAVGFPTVAAAIMVGGVFLGVGARITAVVSGLLGVALGAALARTNRRPLLTNVLVIVGLFAIGVLMVVPGSGLSGVFSVQRLVATAAKRGSLTRPPVEFIAGWHAVVGWLMATVGFAAVWVAVAVKRPSLALLVPMPIAAIAGISVPKDQQVASGLAVLVLFAVGLGLLSSENAAAGVDGEAPSLGYEVRKALKALPLLAAITAGLFFLSKTDFLFPKPVVNPAEEPQKPKTVPLSAVQDRVLFEVSNTKLSGPWRVGSLDVYDGVDWRLPPVAQDKLIKVPGSGIVNPHLPQGVSATFTIQGLGGAVLPALPNTVGIKAQGPSLSYDARNGNIRLTNGAVTPGLVYTVTAPPLPKISDLKSLAFNLPKSVQKYTDMPGAPPPPAVQDLISQAPKTSKWEEFDFLRNKILDNVVAAGPGSPKAITPARVQDMLAGSKHGSPFEIVAAQAMLARWIGIPSRIGYGFDGGDVVEGTKLQVHPKDGASFVEVYFPGYEWLPVIGTPKQAEPTVGSDPGLQKLDASVQPSNDIAVQLYLPLFRPPASVFAKQLLVDTGLVLLLLFFAFVLYTLYPAFRKARVRSTRRAKALAAGTRARVALAYAEWRDTAADFGYAHPTDTPLMFLDRFVGDDEHKELAWLTTRVLWGDLQGVEDAGLATTAEELSRSLRRRLSSAQPATARAVARLSRISLRAPYASETELEIGARGWRARRRRVHAAAAA